MQTFFEKLIAPHRHHVEQIKRDGVGGGGGGRRGGGEGGRRPGPAKIIIKSMHLCDPLTYIVFLIFRLYR